MAQSLSNLPIGAKVKFGKHSINGETALPIIWLVVAKNHSGYVSNSVTLLTEKIIDLRAVDAAEPNSLDANVQRYGYNNYPLSNLNQWLNSANNSWYTASHTNDTPPDNTNTFGGTGYVNRPGFLYNFLASERNAILNNTINIIANGAITTFTTKVYLPSFREVGINMNGVQTPDVEWSYFENNSHIASATEQCYTHSLSTAKPTYMVPQWNYWTRTHNSLNNNYLLVGVTSDGAANQSSAYYGTLGIRPVVNLSNSLLISDTTDSDGCYTFVWNSAPNAPGTLNVPTTIYGGKSNTISWGNTTDPDGDSVTYQLECSVDGGAYTQIYSGTSTTYTHLVSFGTSSVAYRVKATDPSGASSSYITSATITVINNNAPVISGADANLGVKSSGFTGTYTVTDANNNSVTVTESIDGVQIRSLVATLGATITYGITDNTWLALSNGSHTLTIRATDGIDSTVRTYTFTKLVDSIKIQNSTPWQSENMPTRIMIVVTRNIPSAATFKVEVCNNGYDTSPTWEDATDAVRSGLIHVFANTTKTATNWGVLFRVTVNRNGATGACYISAIGGNFE